MSFTEMTFKEYYCLKQGESFSLDPWQDKDIYFGEAAIANRISERIENDFQKRRKVPKFFVFGAWGSGKTHSLAHISYILEGDSMHPTESVYVNIGPMSSKERYHRIHSRLIDAIGHDRIRIAAETLSDQISGTDKVRGFMDAGALQYGDETLKLSQANVFRNFLFGGRQSQLSWEWMKGRKNTPDQAAMIGVNKDLVEAADLVNCLLNVCSLIYKADGHKIVFLMDEGEAIRSVTNADSVSELEDVFRTFADDYNTTVGFVIAIQNEGRMDEIGLFINEAIWRRVDFDRGYIDLGIMVSQIESAKEFILSVLYYLVDQEKASAIIEQERLDIEKETFPFKDEAIDAISSHIAENPERGLASPAFILSVLSDAAIDAWRKRNESETHVLVDQAIIERTLFPEG